MGLFFSGSVRKHVIHGFVSLIFAKKKKFCFENAEKLGLLKYILSEVKYLQEARKAVTKEARTLLHEACLEFGLGNHPFGQELVKLLLEKGFDPSCKDILQKKAVQYVNPSSPMFQLLSKQQGICTCSTCHKMRFLVLSLPNSLKFTSYYNDLFLFLLWSKDHLL